MEPGGPRGRTIYDSITFGNTLSLKVDQGVGAMTISPSGRDVALASRSGLFIIDLDDPFSPPRWLHHITSWEVSDVQWSPHASKPSWVVSTSNQKALVWNLALPTDNAIEHILHGHQRAITDINFHAFNPELLATCSVDSSVNVWDLRDSKRVQQTFADWQAGATQVKWNRRNPNILASSHDSRVQIWDIRAGSRPLHRIQAHSAKVNGVDFSRLEETKLLTCSNDHTVKLWDFSVSSSEPIHTIVTDFPVWRARHTPFGDGCAIMPLRGGQNKVVLSELSTNQAETALEPVLEFPGHRDPVKEFVWRSRGGNEGIEDREFQLVTWSKDNDLRMWPVAQESLERLHYKRGQKVRQNLTRKGAVYCTYREEPYLPLVRSSSSNSGSMVALPPLNTRRMSIVSLSPDKPTRSYNSPDRYGNSGSGNSGGALKSAALAARYGVNHHHLHRTAHMTGGGHIRNRNLMSVVTVDPHLSWIAGVRLGQAAFGPGQYEEEDGLRGSGGQGSPRNLGEELSIVGPKFSKVRFEKISVSTGECVISLNGAWGEDGGLVFMRFEVTFPLGYPHHPAKFQLEEDTDIAPETAHKVMADLEQFNAKLSSSGQYCLEPCLRYLLGEDIKLEDLEPEPDVEELDFVMSFGADAEPTALRRPRHGSSSDESLLTDPDEMVPDTYDEDEDDGEFDGQVDNGREDVNLGVPGDDADDGIQEEVRIGSQFNKAVPLPVCCGALWSPTGQLVCFFEHKEKHKTGLGLAQFLDPESGMLKTRRDVNDGIDIMSSDGGDSENDSGSDEFLDDVELDVDRLHGFTIGHRLSSQLLGGARKRGPLSQGTFKTDPLQPSTINKIVIKDLRDMIPSKYELACEYRVLGSKPQELALHNSIVSYRHGYHDLAECWKLIELILTNDLALHEAMSHPSMTSFRHFSDFYYLSGAIWGYFFWGDHPFGRVWMIDRLFEYFEQARNTQMLAAMSCVLSGATTQSNVQKPSPEMQLEKALSKAVDSRVPPSPFHHDLISREGLDRDYFLNNEDALLSSTTNTPLNTNPHQLAASQGSGIFFNARPWDIPRSSTTVHNATGVDEPASTASSKEGTSFISLSPEHFFSARRAVSNIFTTRNSTNATNSNSGGSPGNGTPASGPTLSRRKRSSDNYHKRPLNLTRSFAGSIHDDELGASSALTSHRNSTTELHARNSYQGIDLMFADRAELELMNVPELDIQLVDDDTYPENRGTSVVPRKADFMEPLLNSHHQKKYELYREQYASMLIAWGLNVKSLEVLKHNYLNKADGQQSYSDKAQFQLRLDFAGSEHAEIISSKAIRKKSYPHTCQYCGLLIKTRFILCGNCEHVLHYDCAREWWGSDPDGDTAKECCSGCGCECLSFL